MMACDYARKMGEGSRGRRGMWDCEICDSVGTLPPWPRELSLPFGLRLPDCPLGTLPHCPPLLQPPLGLTQLLHLLPVATLLLRKPQNTHGRGPFHGYGNPERQAAGWEASWVGELCWSSSRDQREGLSTVAGGMSLELLGGVVWEALCHSKGIRNEEENSSEWASG